MIHHFLMVMIMSVITNMSVLILVGTWNVSDTIITMTSQIICCVMGNERLVPVHSGRSRSQGCVLRRALNWFSCRYWEVQALADVFKRTILCYCLLIKKTYCNPRIFEVNAVIIGWLRAKITLAVFEIFSLYSPQKQGSWITIESILEYCSWHQRTLKQVSLNTIARL